MKHAKESKFQKDLKTEIRNMLPGCMILKTDPNDIQGIPDLLVLYKTHWAALECKASEKSKHRPNQNYRVETMNKMSYAAFVYPENKEEILNEIKRSFGA